MEYLLTHKKADSIISAKLVSVIQFPIAPKSIRTMWMPLSCIRKQDGRNKLGHAYWISIALLYSAHQM